MFGFITSKITTINTSVHDESPCILETNWSILKREFGLIFRENQIYWNRF